MGYEWRAAARRARRPGRVPAGDPEDKAPHRGEPVELMTGLLKIFDGPVLDPFMGSGTVGLACAQVGLPHVGMEVEPAYFEIACKRLEEALK